MTMLWRATLADGTLGEFASLVGAPSASRDCARLSGYAMKTPSGAQGFASTGFAATLLYVRAYVWPTQQTPSVATPIISTYTLGLLAGAQVRLLPDGTLDVFYAPTSRVMFTREAPRTGAWTRITMTVTLSLGFGPQVRLSYDGDQGQAISIADALVALVDTVGFGPTGNGALVYFTDLEIRDDYAPGSTPEPKDPTYSVTSLRTVYARAPY